MASTPSRRDLLRIVGSGAAVGLAGCAGSSRRSSGQTTTDSDTTTGGASDADLPDTIGLEPLSGAFNTPLEIAFAPDADLRYIADQKGFVQIHGPDGVPDETFLDMTDTVVVGNESGLLGLALHPEFAENRRMFVRYSAPPREGTPDDYNHTFVLSEFEVSDDGRSVDRDTERTILEIPEPDGHHNAGAIEFGPDGYLYVAVGDGTSGDDQGLGAASDWYDEVEGGNGQDVTENLLGSILRIDVDDQEGDKGYAIPDDNPLVGEEGLDEHWAWGLRNPFRMAFDGETLIAGDVGESRYEEVDVIEKGGNYGWNVKEATHCFRADECPDSTPDDVRGGEPLIDPVIEYPHEGEGEGVSGISVIGGEVYRGSAMPEMEGVYLFGDWNAQGELFVARPQDGEGPWPKGVVQIAEEDREYLDNRCFGFGRDPDGELYVLGSGSWSGGSVHKVVPPGSETTTAE
ncbi:MULTISPECIES: sorbosone dehydrogenase family protein [Halorussus]|uniref:PQQ-dependent sugar dehydrogenase n=1 Tax=Halorussus TaxID=1070314 RepID=UPI000E219F74|nr:MULTISPECIES: PQQ-dependent sugar dehydrogenase [Halorussus]NHN61428.1 PQQ-dependent sugar dehydrogenase [Halorussus sp. JP-T4]